MLTSYINRAMERAVYEIMEDKKTYWGEVPGLQGVWAHQATLEGYRRELQEALSDWLAFGPVYSDRGRYRSEPTDTAGLRLVPRLSPVS